MTSSQSAQKFNITEERLRPELMATPCLNLDHSGYLVRKSSQEQRDDRSTRIHFEWHEPAGIRYQILASPDADEDFAKTKAFYDAYPDLGICPVVLIPIDGGSCAVFEHFEGVSLEEAIASGSVSTDDATLLLTEIINRLESKSTPVDLCAFHDELDGLCKGLCSSPFWGELDVLFLRRVVFPFLRQSSPFPDDKLRQRWTTGDFVARNILIGTHRELRLIDCEFAVKTVLGPADYQRFGEYSKVPEALRTHILERAPGDKQWWVVHFCVDQAYKLARIRQLSDFARYAPDLLHRMARAISHDESATNSESFLLSLISGEGSSSNLQAHCQTLQNRYTELHNHTKALQSRYDELADHCRKLQAHYENAWTLIQNLQEQNDPKRKKRR